MASACQRGYALDDKECEAQLTIQRISSDSDRYAASRASEITSARAMASSSNQRVATSFLSNRRACDRGRVARVEQMLQTPSR